MSRRGLTLALLAVLLLAVTARGVIGAEGRGSVSAARWDPVWGSLYKLSLQLRSEKGQIVDAEFRAGRESGKLYAADGLLDSGDEWVEAYLEAGGAGATVEVRMRIGSAWTPWQNIEGPDGSGPEASSCAVHSDAGGSGEWFRGSVTVDCKALMAAAGASGVEYSVAFGDWQAGDGSFRVEEEGIHWIQVRTVGEDGVAGLPSTFMVAIDTTAPRLVLQEPPGRQLSHATQLWLDFTAEDDLSGVALVVADLDAEQELMAGVPLELWQLPLGSHVLTVFAKDQAGNVAQLEQPFELEITTDISTLERLVHLFAAQGRVDSYMGFKGRLLKQVAGAEAAMAGGNQMALRMSLEAFIEEVQDGLSQSMIFKDAGETLIGDARWLIATLGDDTGDESPLN